MGDRTGAQLEAVDYILAVFLDYHCERRWHTFPSCPCYECTLGQGCKF